MKTLTITFAEGDTRTLDENQLEGLELECVLDSWPFNVELVYVVGAQMPDKGDNYEIAVSNNSRHVFRLGVELIEYVHSGSLIVIAYNPPGVSRVGLNTSLSSPVELDPKEEEIRKQSAFFFGRTWSSGTR